MGVTNLCMLLNQFYDPIPTTPQHFDTILYDAQSLIHIALALALESEEDKLFLELCQLAWKKFKMQLDQFLSFHKGKLTLIVSFDGDGVPMKYPTQMERRKNGEQCRGKNIYRAALFGTNIIALRVQNYFVKRLRQYQFIEGTCVIVSGCNVPGEGEHKLFYIAQKLPECRHLLVVSEDQDLFIISLMRLHTFESIQIYRYDKYYPITFKEKLPHLETCSFLFGNDFIQALVGISPNNSALIYEYLEESHHESHPVYVIANFVTHMQKHLRFTKVSHMERTLVECFWITFFWLKDYYTKLDFPQKYLENPIYPVFNRNLLLTGLTLTDLSLECYTKAQTLYHTLKRDTVPSKVAIENVFTHQVFLQTVKKYLTTPDDTACVALRWIPKKSSSKSPKSQ